MDSNPGFLADFNKKHSEKEAEKSKEIDIVVLTEITDDEKSPTAAFTSQANLEEFLEGNPQINDFETEAMTLSYKANQQLDYVYLAFLRKDNNEEAFIGYHINRFEAQRRVYKKGFIRSIPLVLDGEVAQAIENSKTKFTKKTAQTIAAPREEPAEIEKKASRQRSLEIADEGKQKVLTFLIIVFVGLVTYFYFHADSNRVEFAENVPSVSWLPGYCNDVSFYKSPKMLVYEFQLSKQGFKKFANELQLEYKPINTPIEVSTYRLYADIRWQGGNTDQYDHDQWKAWEAIARPKIKEGYLFTGYKENPDIRVKGGFDSESDTLYFWSMQ